MTSLFVDYRLICPELELLSLNFPKIREEYIKNKDNLEFKDFTEEQEEYISKNKKGYPITLMSYFTAKSKSETLGWHLAGVYGSGIYHPLNVKYLPILRSILSEISAVSVCGINILDPGISLDWHNDDDYSSGYPTLRTLWGLDVPVEEGRDSIFQMKNSETGDIETRKFKNNGIYAFWPKTIHRVENNMSQPRTVLAVDIFVDKEMVPV
jgi:aspartyl/asparaginyl beta-hydroxylase (cupin superfamily)